MTRLVKQTCSAGVMDLVWRGPQLPRATACGFLALGFAPDLQENESDERPVDGAQGISTDHRGSSVLPKACRGERGINQGLHTESGGGMIWTWRVERRGWGAETAGTVFEPGEM